MYQWYYFVISEDVDVQQDEYQLKLNGIIDFSLRLLEHSNSVNKRGHNFAWRKHSICFLTKFPSSKNYGEKVN